MANFAGQYGPSAMLATSTSGQLVVMPAALVTVFMPNGSTPATLYTDRTKATVAANPTATDAAGNLTVYAVPGNYILSFLVGGSTKTLNIEVYVDPADVTAGSAVSPQVFRTATTSTGITNPNDGLPRNITSLSATFARPCIAAISYKVTGYAAGNAAGNVILSIGGDVMTSRWVNHNSAPAVFPICWTHFQAFATGGYNFLLNCTVDTLGYPITFTDVELTVHELRYG